MASPSVVPVVMGAMFGQAGRRQLQNVFPLPGICSSELLCSNSISITLGEITETAPQPQGESLEGMGLCPQTAQTAM